MTQVISQSEWDVFHDALRRAADRGYANGEAATIQGFLDGFARQAPPEEGVLAWRSQRVLERLAAVASALVEALPLLEKVVEQSEKSRVLQAALSVLAEMARRRDRETPGARHRRLARVMAPILAERLRAKRTVRLTACDEKSDVGTLSVTAYDTPWVVAAVSSKGGVLAALETVSYDPEKRTLELIALRSAACARPILEVEPLEAGRDRIDVSVSDGVYVARDIESERSYRLILRSARRVLGSGVLRFSSRDEKRLKP